MSDRESVECNPPSPVPSSEAPADQEPTSTSFSSRIARNTLLRPREPARPVELLDAQLCHRRVLSVHDIHTSALIQLLKKILSWHYGAQFDEEVPVETFRFSHNPEILELRDRLDRNRVWKLYWLVTCEYGDIEISTFDSVCINDYLPLEDYIAYAYCRRDYTHRHLLHIPGHYILTRR